MVMRLGRLVMLTLGQGPFDPAETDEDCLFNSWASPLEQSMPRPEDELPDMVTEILGKDCSWIVEMLGVLRKITNLLM
jgi:hypothetical protein